MTPAARRLLVAALDAVDGRSWGPRFERIVAALERSDCDELLAVLHAAAQSDGRAWREIVEALDEDGSGLVALDLVVEIGRRQQARTSCRGLPAEASAEVRDGAT